MYPIDALGPPLAALAALVMLGWFVGAFSATALRNRRMARRSSTARLEALGRAVDRSGSDV